MATTTREIDKQLDMPMYHQLYLILKDQIRSGLYEDGSLIPSEAKLQSRYGVSRITVRRAIAELENDGYVQRKKGKGSIVTMPLKSNRNRAIQRCRCTKCTKSTASN